jgi:predicted dehydrogenase
VTKDATALRFGILGAANITTQAFILPAVSHPEVVVAAIASRDEKKCKAFAKKHKIPETYYGADAYQSLSCFI